ncbi:MAG: YigZ family protein [Sphaerochaetaceae bacterium]|nr:YigZ family protein [Spirochaetales bacterium]MDY5499627.1 YigZ family protein [Sphaerochaetaceae bacterium]
MKILLNEPVFQLEVKKSKFIAYARKCSSLEMAKNLVREVRAMHPGANHVVHAAVVGKQGSLFSSSDDKEPKNTAGRPALEVVKGSGITDICILIVRYFGGTLLGTGGLVSAYGDSVKGVITLCQTEEQVQKSSFSLLVSYNQYKPARTLLDSIGAQVDGENFGTDVTISGTIASSQEQKLSDSLTELTGAQALVSFRTIV